MNKSKFTYLYYIKLIQEICNSGYIITNYNNYRNICKPCILRHDVDYDIRKALEFAHFEANIDKNVKSTYFFLTSSDFYNIFSKNTLYIIDRIMALGHEIGLHFDETKYPIKGDKQLFVECVEEELYLLGRSLGITIQVVSMHRPSTFTLENDFAFKNAVNSYAKEFFCNFKYLSDSRMHWKEDVISIIEKRQYDKLHILTHPFWYSEENETAREKILGFIHRANIERFNSIANNFRDLDEFVRLEDVL